MHRMNVSGRMFQWRGFLQCLQWKMALEQRKKGGFKKVYREKGANNPVQGQTHHFTYTVYIAYRRQNVRLEKDALWTKCANVIDLSQFRFCYPFCVKGGISYYLQN